MADIPNAERNIEIKARIKGNEKFQQRVDIARKLTGTEGEIIVQRDVFFNSQSGRLKLRYEQNAKASLVHYDRPDTQGPKLSKYNLIRIDNPDALEKILTAANGAKGVVSKRRTLFIINGTRIHLDKVDNLGNFIEFEVCLRPDQTIEEGEAIAKDLMSVFEIAEDDLMKRAYFDELQTDSQNSLVQ